MFSERYKTEYLAFLISSEIPSLFDDKNISYAVEPVTSACSPKADCSSLFIAGGLNRVSPDPYLFPGDAVIVSAEQGIQCEYWNVSRDEAPMTADQCQIWPTVDGASAFRICIKMSNVDQNVLIAGIVTQGPN